MLKFALSTYSQDALVSRRALAAVDSPAPLLTAGNTNMPPVPLLFRCWNFSLPFNSSFDIAQDERPIQHALIHKFASSLDEEGDGPPSSRRYQTYPVNLLRVRHQRYYRSNPGTLRFLSNIHKRPLPARDARCDIARSRNPHPTGHGDALHERRSRSTTLEGEVHRKGPHRIRRTRDGASGTGTLHLREAVHGRSLGRLPA